MHFSILRPVSPPPSLHRLLYSGEVWRFCDPCNWNCCRVSPSRVRQKSSCNSLRIHRIKARWPSLVGGLPQLRREGRGLAWSVLWWTLYWFMLYRLAWQELLSCGNVAFVFNHTSSLKSHQSTQADNLVHPCRISLESISILNYSPILLSLHKIKTLNLPLHTTLNFLYMVSSAPYCRRRQRDCLVRISPSSLSS